MSILPSTSSRAMPSGKSKFTRTAIIALLPLTASLLTGCHRQAPLAPELAAIACPADRAEHASTMFGKAEVTFVCVTPEIAAKPSMLRCDPNSRPVYCEDSGMITLSRLPGGKLVPGAPSNAREYQPPPVTDPETDAGSLFEASFYDKPPGKANYEVGPRQYLRDADKQRMPPGFTLVNGPVCDRVSTALRHASCRLEAKSASLHWYITISIPRPIGNTIDDELYQQEMTLWLDLLGKMVTDPKS